MGASEYFSTLWPSGRPRCDIRMTEAAPRAEGPLLSALIVNPRVTTSYAPCSMACLMVGRAATMRCADGKQGRGKVSAC